MSSELNSYKSTLDRLTYMNVELRTVPMEFGVEYLERSLKLG